MRVRNLTGAARAASALLAAAFAPALQARPQTTAPSILVNVHVTISDTKIKLTPSSA
jgi:hypothetical protein